jgi:hypothetical protein
VKGEVKRKYAEKAHFPLFFTEESEMARAGRYF